MSLIVRFIKGGLAGQMYPFNPSGTIVGRSRDCDIKVEEKTVSGHHVMLTQPEESGSILLVNLSQRENTTHVDGEVVATNQAVSFALGTVVRLANDAEFVIEPTEGANVPPVMAVGPDGAATHCGEEGDPSGGLTGLTLFGNQDSLKSAEEEGTRLVITDEEGKTQGTHFGQTAIVENKGEPENAFHASPNPNLLGDEDLEIQDPLEDPDGPDPEPDTPQRPNDVPTSIPGFPPEAPKEPLDGPREVGPLTRFFRLLFGSSKQDKPTVISKSGADYNVTIPGMTKPGDTVKVTPSQLMEIWSDWERRRKLRFYMRLGVTAAIALSVAGLYGYLRPSPEKNLSWPCHPNGKWADVRVPLKTSLGENAVGILYPDVGGARCTVETNGTTVITSRLGRDRDVPLRLTFACRHDSGVLIKSRERLFSEELRLRENRGGWNFQAISPVSFLGGDGGIPFCDVQYLRSEKSENIDRQWYGRLMFIVYGSNLITLEREIPAIEQWRGAGLLAREKFLEFSVGTVDAHWEGREQGDVRDAPVENLLAEVDGLLSLKTSGNWKEVEYLLQCALIRSGGKGDGYAKALTLLMSLRTRQKAEFARLRIAYERARHSGGGDAKEEMAKVLKEAQTIFANPNDRRFSLLRKGVWK